MQNFANSFLKIKTINNDVKGQNVKFSVVGYVAFIFQGQYNLACRLCFIYLFIYFWETPHAFIMLNSFSLHKKMLQNYASKLICIVSILRLFATFAVDMFMSICWQHKCGGNARKLTRCLREQFIWISWLFMKRKNFSVSWGATTGRCYAHA